VTVSPIRASVTVLMPAKMNPTSPTPSSSTGVGLGEKTPTWSTSIVLPGGHQADLHPGLDRAVDDAREDDHAAVGSYHESKISAFSGASGSPLRGRQPVHDRLEDLVDAGALLGARPGSRGLASRPMMSSIWRLASSGCAPGRSILLMTGMISRSLSTAR
jgi:hypothetical protein